MMIQLRLDNGPAHFETRAGPGFPLRVFRKGKVTIIDGPRAEEEARKLVDIIRLRDRNWRVLEVSESGIFSVDFDCGVVAPVDFKQQLSGLLVQTDPGFRSAFIAMLAAGSKAVAAEDEADAADATPTADVPKAEGSSEVEKPKVKNKVKGPAITSADVPKAEG